MFSLRNQSLRNQIIEAGLLVTLAALTLSSIVSFEFYRNHMLAELKAKNQEILNQNRRVFHTQHFWLIPFFFQLDADQRIARVTYGGEVSLYDISRGLDALDEALQFCPYLTSLTVWNPKDKFVLSTRGGLRRPDDFDGGFTAVKEMVKDAGLYRYYPAYNAIAAGGNRRPEAEPEALRLFFSRRPVDDAGLGGVLIVELDVIEFRNLFLNDDGRDDLVVVDARGRLISYPEGMYPAARRELPLFTEIIGSEIPEGSTLKDIEEETRLISWRIDTDIGLGFFKTADFERLIAPMRRLRNLQALLGIVALTAAALLLVPVSRYIARPVIRLFRKARSVPARFGGIREPATGSEAGYVERVLTGVAREAAAMDEYVKHRRIHNVKQILMEILLGQVRGDGLSEDQLSLVEQWRRGQFRIVLVRLFTSKADEIEPFFRDYAEGLFNPLFPDGTIRLNIARDHIVFILPEDEESAIPRDALASALLAVKESTGIFLTIGLSDSPAGMDGFSNGYVQALGNSRNQFLHALPMVQESRVSLPEDVPRMLDDETVQSLWTAYYSRKDEQRAVIWDRLESRLRLGSFDGFVHGRNLLTAEARGRTAGNIRARKRLQEALYRLEHAQTIAALKESCESVFQILSETEGEAESRERNLISRVKSAVEQSVDDPNLCVEGLAAAMRVSSGHLRRIFKRHQGQSLSAFIAEERLELSKELLRTTDLTVKEIAVMSGAINYNYFFTAFRSRTGMTPRDFRLASIPAVRSRESKM